MPTLQLDGNASGAVRAHSQLDAAVEKSKQGYQNLSLTADQLREQLKKAYDEKPIDTYIRKCDELAKKLVEGKINAHQYVEQTDRLAASLNKGGQAHEAAFGSEALTHVVELAAGYMSLEKAVGVVIDALREEAELRKRLAESNEGETLRSAGALRRVGGTDEDVKFAQRFAAEGLVDPKNEGPSFRATAGMVKAKLTAQEREYAFGLVKDETFGADEIGEYVQDIKSLQRNFGGTFQSQSAKILQAGKLTKFEPGEIAVQMTRIADKAKDAGISEDQALATYMTFIAKEPIKKRAGTAAEKFIEQGDRFEGTDSQTYSEQMAAMAAATGAPPPPSISEMSPELGMAEAAERTGFRNEARLKRGTATRESAAKVLAEIEENSARVNGTSFDVWASRRVAGARRMFGGEDSALEHSNERGVFEQAQKQGVITSEELSTVKEYLRGIHEEAQKQTTMMERGDRSPPPPEGRPPGGG